jgi:hypothetical protein
MSSGGTRRGVPAPPPRGTREGSLNSQGLPLPPPKPPKLSSGLNQETQNEEIRGSSDKNPFRDSNQSIENESEKNPFRSSSMSSQKNPFDEDDINDNGNNEYVETVMNSGLTGGNNRVPRASPSISNSTLHTSNLSTTSNTTTSATRMSSLTMSSFSGITSSQSSHSNNNKKTLSKKEIHQRNIEAGKQHVRRLHATLSNIDVNDIENIYNKNRVSDGWLVTSIAVHGAQFGLLLAIIQPTVPSFTYFALFVLAMIVPILLLLSRFFVTKRSKGTR